MVNFCISTTNSSNDNISVINGVNFNAGGCGTCNPSLGVPLSMIGYISVSSKTEYTFYLLAQVDRGSQGANDLISLASSNIYTVFLPKEW